MKYTITGTVVPNDHHQAVIEEISAEIEVGGLPEDHRLNAIDAISATVSGRFFIKSMVPVEPLGFRDYLSRFNLTLDIIHPTRSDILHSTKSTLHGKDCREKIAEYNGWLERWQSGRVSPQVIELQDYLAAAIELYSESEAAAIKEREFRREVRLQLVSLVNSPLSESPYLKNRVRNIIDMFNGPDIGNSVATIPKESSFWCNGCGVEIVHGSKCWDCKNMAGEG